MTEPTMTLPNGDVLHDGDWGRTRGGSVVQIRPDLFSGTYPWAAKTEMPGFQYSYRADGRYSHARELPLDIVAIAPSAPIAPVVSQELRDFAAMYHAAKKAGLL